MDNQIRMKYTIELSEYEEVIFSTSEWNACQDYYQGFDVYTKNYQDQHEINWTIEDI